MPYYDDPAICYDGAPTDSLIGQLVSAVQANPHAVLAALQGADHPVPVNAVQMAGAPIIGDGSEANMWRGAGAGFLVNQNATTNLNVTSATYIGLAYA